MENNALIQGGSGARSRKRSHSDIAAVILGFGQNQKQIERNILAAAEHLNQVDG